MTTDQLIAAIIKDSKEIENEDTRCQALLNTLGHFAGEDGKPILDAALALIEKVKEPQARMRLRAQVRGYVARFEKVK